MARGATAAPLLWCCTWTEMRELAGGKKQKERGLLSIKCWYPERQLRFITINRLDGNWGFVISQCNGSVVQSVDGPAVLMTASHQRKTLGPPHPQRISLGSSLLFCNKTIKKAIKNMSDARKVFKRSKLRNNFLRRSQITAHFHSLGTNTH